MANEKGHTTENEANHNNKYKRLDLSANSMKSSHEGDTKHLNLKGGGQDQHLSSSSLLLRDNVFRPPYENTNNEDEEIFDPNSHIPKLKSTGKRGKSQKNSQT